MNRLEFIQKVEEMGLSVKDHGENYLLTEVEGIGCVLLLGSRLVDPDVEDLPKDWGLVIDEFGRVRVWEFQETDLTEPDSRHHVLCRSEDESFEHAYSKIVELFAKKQAQ